MDYPGIYRATVSTNIVDDADGRMRVRVRVDGVHDKSTPAEVLPLADLCQLVGKMRGKFFPFQTNDRVWIMFEGGIVSSPVILGGQITNSADLPDVPVDQQVEQHPDVVIEQDAAGNTVIHDGRISQRKMIYRSGGASITISGAADRLVLEASQGAIEVRGANVNVVAGNAAVQATQVTIEANGQDLLQQDGGVLAEKANHQINRLAKPTVQAVAQTDAIHGKINDGGNVPNMRGTPMPTSPAEQSNVHNLRSRFVNIGVGPTGFVIDPNATDADLSPVIDYEPTLSEAAASASTGVPALPFPLKPTIAINIRSQAQVNITSEKVTLGGTKEINIVSQADINLTALRDVKAHVVGEMNVSAGKLTTFVTGAANISASGDVTLDATNKVTAVVGGDFFASIGGKLTAVVGGTLQAQVGGDAMLNVGGRLEVLAGSSVHIASGGSMMSMESGEIILAGATLSLVGNLLINNAPYAAHTHLYSPGPGSPSPTTPPIA